MKSKNSKMLFNSFTKVRRGNIFLIHSGKKIFVLWFSFRTTLKLANLAPAALLRLIPVTNVFFAIFSKF